MECDYCRNEIETVKHRQYTGGNFDVIKETVPLPFICKRCGGSFCADHRLPETHDCIGLVKNNKFYISDDLNKDIIEHQIIDIPQNTPYESRTPDDFIQYVIKKQKSESSSKVDTEIERNIEKTYASTQTTSHGEHIKIVTKPTGHYMRSAKKMHEKSSESDTKIKKGMNRTLKQTRDSSDKKTKILIAIIITILVLLYIILFAN